MVENLLKKYKAIEDCSKTKNNVFLYDNLYKSKQLTSFNQDKIEKNGKEELDNSKIKSMKLVNPFMEMSNSNQIIKNELFSTKQSKLASLAVATGMKSIIEESQLEEEMKEIERKNLDLMKKCELYNTDKIKGLKEDFIQKKRNQIEHSNTTGKGWYNMSAPEITPEIENDLRTLQLRNIINPNRFYKKADSDTLPKFFQIGTVQSNITQGKAYTMRKSEKKQSLAEEFLDVEIELFPIFLP